MKKVFYAFIMMLGLFVGFRTVNAATESDLRKKLDETFTINGEKYTIPSDIKVSLKRYLDEYEVSDKEFKYPPLLPFEFNQFIKPEVVQSLLLVPDTFLL